MSDQCRNCAGDGYNVFGPSEKHYPCGTCGGTGQVAGGFYDAPPLASSVCPICQTDKPHIGHAPIFTTKPPMTRCPKSPENDSSKWRSGNSSMDTPAPHAAPLDFEKCEKETGAPVCAGLDYPVREALQRQARAYAGAVVKAERARIAMALIECEDIHGRGKAERGAGCDYCAGWLDAADFVTTSGEARDDHR